MDRKIIDAVQFYWKSRNSQKLKQAESGVQDMGARGAVTGGAQMDAFADLVSTAIVETGIPSSCIFKKTAVELPGYYRPEKKWDLLVVYNEVLGAAIELKSQMGPSFGNNFNNRTEEAIGSATDIWVAYREKRFGEHMFKPWLGYLFLLEDCEASTTPVAVKEPHFEVDEVFKGASYKKRYEIFCQRLILERVYDSSCFVTAKFSENELNVSEPNDNLSFEHFISSLKGHMQNLRSQFIVKNLEFMTNCKSEIG
jgi:hypothetical protein